MYGYIGLSKVIKVGRVQGTSPIVWVAVKELSLSYYIGETLLFTRYTHYGNLI